MYGSFTTSVDAVDKRGRFFKGYKVTRHNFILMPQIMDGLIIVPLNYFLNASLTFVCFLTGRQSKNVTATKLKNDASQIIDIPGHKKVRNTIKEKYKNKTRGVFFVIDCQTVLKYVCDVAECLHSVLAGGVFRHRALVLNFNNKQDFKFYKSAKGTKTCLETEIVISNVATTAQIVNKKGINPLRIALALTSMIVTPTEVI